MSPEGGNIQPIKPAKEILWRTFREDLFKREPKIAEMIEEGIVDVEWLEDKNGNPECVKVFAKDGTMFFFEEVEASSRLKNIMKDRRNKSTRLDGPVGWEF